MRYRADIDGLRAVAILPILLFHAGLSFLAGGFVGVDIFFVISGFLITSIIVPQMEESHFSLGLFYQRRIVRIFPALFVMLGIVLAVGCMIMMPSEIKELGRSAVAASSFWSNIFFWKTADYFGGLAETKPLLHTWSLGVEEQFYILFPLLLIIIRRISPSHVKTWMVAIAITSFILAVGATARWPGAAFYLLPNRAWELAIGALVSLGGFPRIKAAKVKQFIAAIGALFIAISIILVRPDAGFPAPAALIPVLGAALLIAYELLPVPWTPK